MTPLFINRENSKQRFYSRLGIGQKPFIKPSNQEPSTQSPYEIVHKTPFLKEINISPEIERQLSELTICDDIINPGSDVFAKFRLNQLNSIPTLSPRLKDVIANLSNQFLSESLFSEDTLIIKVFFHQTPDLTPAMNDYVLFDKFKFHLDFFDAQFSMIHQKQTLPLFSNVMVYCGNNFKTTELAAIDTIHYVQQFKSFNEFLITQERNPLPEQYIISYASRVQHMHSDTIHRAPIHRNPNDLVISFRSLDETIFFNHQSS
jgi:hypothetical protein